MGGVGRIALIVPGLVLSKTRRSVELAVASRTFEMVRQGARLSVGDVVFTSVLETGWTMILVGRALMRSAIVVRS